MFNLFGSKKVKKNRYPGKIYATQDGVAVPLAEVPDAMIGGGVLGDGIAIIPTGSKVVAPVDGTVMAIAKSKHAFCLVTSDELEVMVHIGVDTVALNGEGFDVLVEKGSYILAGTPMCEVDLSLLSDKNISPITATLIINHAQLGKITPTLGGVCAGDSMVMQYIC